MFSYEPLLILLVKRKMNREQLRRAIGASFSTMTKISKNEPVSLDVIGRICEFLECRVEDVMEYIPEKNNS